MLKLVLSFIYLEDCLILLRDFIFQNVFEHFWGILEFEILSSIFRDFKISNINESFWGILEFGTLLNNSFPWTRAGPPVVRPAGPRAPHAEKKEMSQFCCFFFIIFLCLIFLHHRIIVSQQKYIVNRWLSQKVNQWATIPRCQPTIWCLQCHHHHPQDWGHLWVGEVELCREVCFKPGCKMVPRLQWEVVPYRWSWLSLSIK